MKQFEKDNKEISCCDGCFIGYPDFLIVVMTIWNSIETKKDLEVIATTKYGAFYTTSNGDRVNYTLYDSESEQVVVILPGLECISAHYEFDA